MSVFICPALEGRKLAFYGLFAPLTRGGDPRVDRRTHQPLLLIFSEFASLPSIKTR
jgi:hypothetical protein